MQPGGTVRRIECAPQLVPAAGQYLLADDGSAAPLAVSVFGAGASPGGFLAAPPLPEAWTPGSALKLHGPLGRGFSLPPAARRIALLALDRSVARLLPLIPPALVQHAAVTLVCAAPPPDLPEDVEVQALTTWMDVLAWADYLAVDIHRDDLSAWIARLGQAGAAGGAQILVRTQMPCAGIAECGICAVAVKREWKMACKDGPVFDMKEVLG